MHVLATFLGGGQKRRYREANYRFDDGSEYKTPLFGWALIEHLKHAGSPIDRLVVFGTPTSFWEHLLEIACPGDTAIGELTAMAERGISRRELVPFEPLILQAARNHGVSQVNLELIDRLDTSEEQMGLIGQIADLLERGDRLTLDVTHGLRHQPMLSTVAALALRGAGHAGDISGIFYGAFDMTSSEGETPVLQLDPLLAYADWIEALARAEVSGEYGPIADRLHGEGVDKAACDALAEGSFLQAIGNYEGAVEQFTRWKQIIGGVALRGAAALFIGEINARIDVLMAGDRLLRLIDDAEGARERGALVRAAELGLEAALLILDGQGLGTDRRDGRSRSSCYHGKFEKWMNGRKWQDVKHLPQARWKQAFNRLNGMRNAMAHLDHEGGGAPEARRALASRETAASALKDDFDALFKVDPEKALDLS